MIVDKEYYEDEEIIIDKEEIEDAWVDIFYEEQRDEKYFCSNCGEMLAVPGTGLCGKCKPLCGGPCEPSAHDGTGICTKCVNYWKS